MSNGMMMLDGMHRNRSLNVAAEYGVIFLFTFLPAYFIFTYTSIVYQSTNPFIFRFFVFALASSCQLQVPKAFWKTSRYLNEWILIQHLVRKYHVRFQVSSFCASQFVLSKTKRHAKKLDRAYKPDSPLGQLYSGSCKPTANVQKKVKYRSLERL